MTQGRKRNELAPQHAELFKQLAHRNLPVREIVVRLAAAGVTGWSAATVQRRLGEMRGKVRLQQASPIRREPLPPLPAPTPDAGASVASELVADLEDGAGVPTDVLALLRRQVKALEGMATAEGKTENLAGVMAIQRVLNQSVALLAKLEPPVPADPNEAPDVQVAAAEARELLHTAVERAIKRRMAG